MPGLCSPCPTCGLVHLIVVPRKTVREGREAAGVALAERADPEEDALRDLAEVTAGEMVEDGVVIDGRRGALLLCPICGDLIDLRALARFSAVREQLCEPVEVKETGG